MHPGSGLVATPSLPARCLHGHVLWTVQAWATKPAESVLASQPGPSGTPLLLGVRIALHLQSTAGSTHSFKGAQRALP